MATISAYTKVGQIMFSYFFYCEKITFFAKKGHGPMASVNMPMDPVIPYVNLECY